MLSDWNADFLVKIEKPANWTTEIKTAWED